MFLDPKSKSKLQAAIDNTLFEMESHPASSEEYGTMLDRVKQLHKLKEEEKPSRPSPDTLILVGANLVGIAMILRHEHLNVITSKALGFVLKPK
jgi:hypothetical protein